MKIFKSSKNTHIAQEIIEIHADIIGDCGGDLDTYERHNYIF
ncbi:hypothetical protein [Methanoregula sp. UBA64]|jgi:hypothetical protein|nr:hypothetical protein [Methanoregula sp. UBA64]